jgi:hypothetical protein
MFPTGAFSHAHPGQSDWESANKFPQRHVDLYGAKTNTQALGCIQAGEYFSLLRRNFSLRQVEGNCVGIGSKWVAKHGRKVHGWRAMMEI